MPADLTEPAPAKVNLFLHVLGRRGDGYHLLDSLVVFPEVGDTLRAVPAETLSLRSRGRLPRGSRPTGQPCAARREGAGGGGRHRRARPSGLGQAPAGGLRHRRGFGGRCGGAAAALPPMAD